LYITKSLFLLPVTEQAPLNPQFARELVGGLPHCPLDPREMCAVRSAQRLGSERRLSQIKYWTTWILGRHKSLNL
jgi:hypothetical protein